MFDTRVVMVAAELMAGLTTPDGRAKPDGPATPDGRAKDVGAAERRARLRLVGDKVKPLALARERTLPVRAELAGLFPDRSLRRGSVVGVDGPGATSLALAVAAGPSDAGSWTALVGDPDVGLAAAGEMGVVLERLLVVQPPEPSMWASAVAALVGAVDVVVVAPRHRVRANDTRRLTSRLRERGSVIVAVGPAWTTGVDIGLRVDDATWSGLGRGHGVVQSRRVSVRTHGKGSAAQPRRAELLLPGPEGAPVLVESPVVDQHLETVVAAPAVRSA